MVSITSVASAPHSSTIPATARRRTSSACLPISARLFQNARMSETISSANSSSCMGSAAQKRMGAIPSVEHWRTTPPASGAGANCSTLCSSAPTSLRGADAPSPWHPSRRVLFSMSRRRRARLGPCASRRVPSTGMKARPGRVEDVAPALQVAASWSMAPSDGAERRFELALS